MRLSQVVRSGPGQYICEAGALDYLPEKLTGFAHPVIISGTRSLQAFQQYAPHSMSTIPSLIYDGSASQQDMRRLAQLATQADVIIGVGGGKALDTAKGVAELLDIENIMIPTVLGTCAACTPLSATYHPDHSFNEVIYFKRSAFLVLLDLSLLLSSPKNYFLGGIGDTLAKWYEAEAITRHLDEDLRSAMVLAGLNMARQTQEILLNNTPQALQSMDMHKVTPAFRQVCEAVVAIAGMVGGCAGEYGRMAGAHAIHNAMSFLPQTHDILHGVKVAYGILVQLIATGDQDEVIKLLPFYRENGFPYHLASLGIDNNQEHAVQVMAEFAAKQEETFHLAVAKITTSQIADAIWYLEQLAAQE
jgi:uncharacterized oxidoreductase